VSYAPARETRAFVAAVSDLALIIMAAPDMSCAHEGIKPQRISDNSRRGSFGFCLFSCFVVTGVCHADLLTAVTFLSQM
jgi:hypothetical protein